MRLRTAIKITRTIENDFFNILSWKPSTVWKARDICRRHYMDRRVPFIPSDEELIERHGLLMSLFAEVVIDDESDRDEFKERLWSNIEKAKGER